ncbi:MAG: two-component system phosphate regulon response regulator PhoB [Oleiphilaceae bacterium]|jgi:two-component system phosphate regulon response regulator PhoB
MDTMSPEENIILTVNNKASLVEAITSTLEKVGFEWHKANSRDEVYSVIQNKKLLLISLNWMQSGTISIDLIHKLKQDKRSCNMPIIMPSKKKPEQVLQGLEAGADDCISTPLSHRELIARLKVILRRYAPKIVL